MFGVAQGRVFEVNILTITLITALRAACIALIAVGAAAKGGRLMARPAVMWLMLIVLLMPGIFIGYHSAVSRSATTSGWSAEVTYSIIVLLRITPLAVVLMWLVPPRMTARSAHAFRMMSRVSAVARLRWKLHGWCAEYWPTFCIVFLVVFQEFDLAACWNARSWTIALFDFQAGGLALSESLRVMLPAIAIECVVLGALMFRLRQNPSRAEREQTPSGRESVWVIIGLLVLPVSAVAMALSNGWAGLPALRENFALTREVTNSFLLATVATIAAWLLAAWAYQSRVRTILLALPGLFGGLIVSLTLLALFQIPPLPLLRASPLPVLLALVLTQMPTALFIQHILARIERSEAAHVAALGQVHKVHWQLVRRPALLGGALLFLQAYADFTANSLLAPPALTSAFSRIFNLMHYGQTAALSAMLLVTIAVPLFALIVAAFFVRTRTRLSRALP